MVMSSTVNGIPGDLTRFHGMQWDASGCGGILGLKFMSIGFFVKVYVYDYKPDGDHSCCVRVEDISSEFPPASQSDRRSSSNETYENNLDSIYFSYYRNSIYFIKGDDVWENKRYKLNGGQRQNSISYNGKWYDTWQFLCDGECS